MTDKDGKPKTVVIVDDRLWRSVARDSYTFGLLAALTAVGYVLGISALSWIGGLLWMIVIISWAARLEKSNRMTIAKARALLEQMEERE